MIYTLRTTIGRENIVIESLTSRIKAQHIDIRALLHPTELKGYVFIEGDVENIQKVIQGVPHVRGLVPEPIDLSKIAQFLKPKTVQVEFNRGDLAEITGGAFKGERGKISRVDKAKNEVTIELLEAAVPMPVTVSADFISIIERADKTEEKKEGQ